MKIKHAFIREEDSYSRLALENIFNTAGEHLDWIIQKLLDANVLKKSRSGAQNLSGIQLFNYELDDTSVMRTNELTYTFHFVGIISIAGYVLKVLPKYLPMSVSDSEKTEHLQLVFSVLSKYTQSLPQDLKSPSSLDRDKAFNLLPLILFLLNDYYDEGLYRNTREIIETNGSGEILWERTVNETCPLLAHGQLYYFDLKTKKRTNDEADYFRRLHSCILTMCYQDLISAGLASIFGLPEVYLCDDSLAAFGDKEFIKLRLLKELNVVFDSRRQMLLRKMYDYVDESTGLIDEDCCTFYGTTSFNLVWEYVCSTIFKSQLNEELQHLILPEQLRNTLYPPNSTLQEIIDKPIWKKTGAANGVPAKTLKPDIVTITSPQSLQNTSITQVRSYVDKDGKFKFLIFDAKYYTMTLDETQVSGQPGVSDVTKQYLYQVAFNQFIKEGGFTHVRNCFILPTYGDSVLYTGEVSMKMLQLLGLESIKLRHIPVKDAYRCYLQDAAYPIDKLALDVAA